MAQGTWENALSAQLGEEPSDERIRAAVALLVAGDEREVALIQRAVHPSDPWSGHIALPGGRRDPADSDLLSTALRETAEEIGVVVPRNATLGALPQVQAQSRPGPNAIWVAPFVVRLPERPRTVPNHEVAQVHWVSLQELRDPASQTTFQYQADAGTRFNFPGIRVGEGVVWGLTWRILQDFFARLP
jgi:8-oxo-dGTP pyrophosphatase MutT (NUDIX family)